MYSFNNLVLLFSYLLELSDVRSDVLRLDVARNGDEGRLGVVVPTVTSIFLAADGALRGPQHQHQHREHNTTTHLSI